MFYNHRVKVYPDGTETHYIYSKSKQKNFEVLADVKENEEIEHDGSSVERKEIDNQKRAREKVYDYARSNTFDFFVTLTFSDSEVDRYDYDACTTKLRQFTDWLGRNNCSYIFVPEQHKDGAYHFHGLVKGALRLSPAVNPHTLLQIPDVFNISNYNLGFSTATRIKDPQRTASYITKYLTKDMTVPKGRRRYWASKNLLLPVIAFDDTFIDSYYISKLRLVADYCKVCPSEYGTLEILEVRNP